MGKYRKLTWDYHGETCKSTKQLWQCSISIQQGPMKEAKMKLLHVVWIQTSNPLNRSHCAPQECVLAFSIKVIFFLVIFKMQIHCHRCSKKWLLSPDKHRRPEVIKYDSLSLLWCTELGWNIYHDRDEAVNLLATLTACFELERLSRKSISLIDMQLTLCFTL